MSDPVAVTNWRLLLLYSLEGQRTFSGETLQAATGEGWNERHSGVRNQPEVNAKDV